MGHSVAMSLGFLIIFSLACTSALSALVSPIVNTTYGPVRGEAVVLNTNKTLVRYLGIPFGHVKRFEAPESPTPWKNTLNATSFGKSCPQNPNFFVMNPKDTGEQCLTINVFVPQDKADQNALLPVMVWIYGGGYNEGGAGISIYNAAYLATEGGVMVVTFNYRLGVLGFLSTGTKEMPGNFGLLDQVKALHWVHDNIQRFGGDPKQVTIFGESAGGSSVALHMLSPLSSGLYSKVILQSGTAATTFTGIDNKTAIDSARTFASRLGCSMSELKKCLLSKTLSELLKAQKNMTVNAVIRHRFVPVVDYNFLHDLPFNLLVNGKFNQTVPAMIGVTKNEGGLYVLPVPGISPGVPSIGKGINKTTFDSLVKREHRWVYNQTQKVTDAVIFEYTDWANQTNPLILRQKYMDVVSDAVFKAPAVRSAEVFVKNNIPTYFYCLDHFVAPPFLPFPPWAGVVHSSDLIYVFGEPFTKYNKSAGNQSVEVTFSKQIISFWSNFAKNGKPTEDATTWPGYTLEDKKYISLSPKSSIQKNMLPEKMAFWNSFVPSLTEPQPTMAPINPITTKPAPVTIGPTAHKEAITSKATENALIAVVVVLAVLVVVLVVVIWRIRSKLKDAVSDPGPTTKLI